MKVLIIDDDADIRRLAAAFLARAGMTVMQAESGEAGLEFAAAQPPDVILLDAMMPGLDGPATLAALRQRPSTAAVPVIFLTAASHPQDRERLTSLDALGVIAKPFSPPALAALVRDMMTAPR